MKLLIISPYIATTTNDIFYQSQQLNIARELSYLGVEVTIVSAKREHNQKNKFENNTELIFLNKLKYFPEKYFNQPVMLGISNILLNKKYDLILTSEYQSITTFIVSLCSLIFNLNFIIYQGVFKKSSGLKQLFLNLWDFSLGFIIKKNAKYVICKTNTAKKYLHSKGFHNISVIPIGVNTSLFYMRELNNQSKSKRINLLTIASLIKRKNIELMIKALNLLKNSGVKFNLIIIGDGPRKKNISKTINDLNLSHQISLIPEVENSNLVGYYNNADYTLSFSDDEIFGMTILESLACGCPVITNRQPGPVDVIVDKFNGYLIETNDPESISRSLMKIFKLKNLDRKKIALNTKLNYDWKVIADRHLNLYNNIIN